MVLGPMERAILTISVRELVRFFDEKPKGTHGHATAVVGVLGEDLSSALLVRCLAERYGDARLVSRKCTTGKQRGPRLDCWVGATVGAAWTLFQVEIKSWSAHAIGGKILAVDAGPDDLRAHRIERWRHQWNGETFRNKAVRKVLHPMKQPEQGHVKPLACFWDAMHPDGHPDPLFVVPVTSGTFDEVWVFSVSSYLRGLSAETLELEMRAAAARLGWLARLVALSPNEQAT